MVNLGPELSIGAGLDQHRRIMKQSAQSTSLSGELESFMAKGFTLAVQILGCREDAADVVQESLRTLLHGGTFDSARGRKQAFFMKVVRNRSLDLIRRRKPHDADLVENLSDRSRTPDRAVELRELDGLLRRQLDELPEDHKEILLLRDFHDLSYAEIAEVMEVPQGTVMSRLHRARSGLRARMREFL